MDFPGYPVFGRVVILLDPLFLRTPATQDTLSEDEWPSTINVF
jgi:hypothetical protein